MKKPKKPEQDSDLGVPNVVPLKIKAQVEAMQTPGARPRVKVLFAAAPEEIGAATVKGAAKQKSPEQLAAVAKIKEAFASHHQFRAKDATQSVWASGRRTIGFEGLDAEGQLAEIARLKAEPVPRQPIE